MSSSRNRNRKCHYKEQTSRQHDAIRNTPGNTRFGVYVLGVIRTLVYVYWDVHVLGCTLPGVHMSNVHVPGYTRTAIYSTRTGVVPGRDLDAVT